jgi:hypothetical protein
MNNIVYLKTKQREVEISDEYLAHLADNFIKKGHKERYRIPFSKYVEMKLDGTWKAFKEWN